MAKAPCSLGPLVAYGSLWGVAALAPWHSYLLPVCLGHLLVGSRGLAFLVALTLDSHYVDLVACLHGHLDPLCDLVPVQSMPSPLAPRVPRQFQLAFAVLVNLCLGHLVAF